MINKEDFDFEKLKIIFESLSKINIGICVISADYNILFENNFLKTSFGEVVGKKCFAVYNEFSFIYEINFLNKAIKSKNPETKEIFYNNKIYNLIVLPIFDSKDEICCLLESVTVNNLPIHQENINNNTISNDYNNTLNGILASIFGNIKLAKFDIQGDIDRNEALAYLTCAENSTLKARNLIQNIHSEKDNLLPHKKLFKKNNIPYGKILLMDDEEIVRDTTGKMLNYLGYEVKFAKEGKEAVTVYKKYFDTKEHFDFVILDLSIPGGMGGEETIKLLKTINPFIKAIVFSGYYHNPVISNYLDYGFSGVLKKPFDFYELENIILRMSNE